MTVEKKQEIERLEQRHKQDGKVYNNDNLLFSNIRKGNEKNRNKSKNVVILSGAACVIIGVIAISLFYILGVVPNSGATDRTTSDCYKAYRRLKSTEHAYYFGGGSNEEYQNAQRIYMDCILNK